MGKLLNPNTYTNSGTAEGQNPKTGVGLADLASNQVLISDLSGAKPPQTAVILDGVITPTGAFCKVGTEGEAPADDLARINSTRTADDVIHEGMVLHLCALDDAQVVTLKHSADIILAGGVDVALSTDRYIVLQYIQGVWREVQIAMGVDVKTSIAGVQDTFSTTAAVGKAPVAITDPETGEVGFDDSWKMGGGSSIAGTVVAFAGTFNGKNPIPLGETEADLTWQICDGTNGTPNLVDKFIYGGDGTTQGAEGGDVVTEGHTLTVDEMAAHDNHLVGRSPTVVDDKMFPYGQDSGYYPQYRVYGGSQPHVHNQNLPPHIVLAYIMKLPQA